MIKFAKAAAIATTITLAACGPTEPAPVVEGAWTLDGDASRLTYVSIKSGEIAETNEFKALSGNVTPDGEATVEIDLASLETGVDIRNERMREFFFEVADHPTATVTAKLDPRGYDFLKVGDSTVAKVDGTLTVKGVEAKVEAEVDVTRTGADRMTVVTTKPVIVMADALELTEGLGKLQELAGLPSITPAVPVTFNLEFERK